MRKKKYREGGREKGKTERKKSRNEVKERRQEAAEGRTRGEKKGGND